jgi:hypothetical protein
MLFEGHIETTTKKVYFTYLVVSPFGDFAIHPATSMQGYSTSEVSK